MINSPIRALVVRAGGRQQDPWWWKHIEHDPTRCQINYHVIPLKGGKLNTPASIRFVGLLVRTLALLVQMRRKYDYVFTILDRMVIIHLFSVYKIFKTWPEDYE